MREISFKKYPIHKGYEFSYDVGWKVREKLSNKNFFTFNQREASELNKIIGVHSFETLTREYFYKDATIGFHLFRGTFTGMVQNHKDPKQQIKKAWLNNRNRYGSYFYKYLKNERDPIFLIKERYYKFILFLPLLIKKIIYGYLARTIKRTALGRSALRILKHILIKIKILP